MKEPIKIKEDYKEYIASKSSKVNKKQKEAMIKDLEKEMKESAKALDFERAAQLRDIILELKSELN